MLLLLLLLVSVISKSPPPHVVMFIMDDVGLGDMDWNDPTMFTPTLNSLRGVGVNLGHYYSAPVCSPSRSSILTGRQSWNIGMQHYDTIMPASTAAIPLNVPTIAEMLRNSSYQCESIGKWHAGYARWENTPTGRGFHHHTGYFQGELDYTNHTFRVPSNFLPSFVNITGFDWWTGHEPLRNTTGVHAKTLLDAYMNQVLNNRNQSSPLFLYYAHQLAHVPLEPVPGGVPPHCRSIVYAKRQMYCSMMASLDDSLALLVARLRSSGMWDNTLLIVVSDNGAMVDDPNTFPPSAGSNWPLRAGKGTVFEGGVRVPALVTGGALPEKMRNTTLNQLLSVVDWVPTICDLTQACSFRSSTPVDGMSMWPLLSGASTSELRNVLGINVNYHVQFPDKGYQVGIVAQIAQHWWKLVLNNVTGKVLNYDGWYYPGAPVKPAPKGNVFLFDLTTDPTEHNDLSSSQPQVLSQMQEILRTQIMPYYVAPSDNRFHVIGMPEFHKGLWAPFI